jgi:3',5'-cyclic-nucleotide phosphodiesterase
MKNKIILFFLLSITFQICIAQKSTNTNSFSIIPLGVKGGLDESNLSAYLIAANGSKNYICLDAGTINAGLQKAVQKNLFDGTDIAQIQKNYIKGYFVSHAHLDHVAGLIINSPNDIAKNIYGFASVIEVLKNNYFTWKAWANFTNEGDKPQLSKYSYNYLSPGKEINITNTELSVTPYLLSHVNPYESSAFLIRNNNSYVLYLGDTGPDSIEFSTKLKELWTAVSGPIQRGELKAIFIEVSFDNSTPDKLLFGHLTPRLLMQELRILNEIAGGKLNQVQIFITHMKPCVNCEENIKDQISSENNLGLTIRYPTQGMLININN